jgi:F-type H+-transporting ATPase subunit epsilon
MAKTPYNLSIVTPAGTAFEGEVVSLVFPGEDGAIGVWAHHAPMLAAMRAGTLTVEEAGHAEVEKHFAVGSGFAEVSDNRATLLVDSCEAAQDIDVQRAKAAVERAKRRLAEATRDDSIDRERAQAALERAEARLKAGYTRGR